jgi:hypothetical protein
MNELGNQPRDSYRQTYPKYVDCSNCHKDRLAVNIQDTHRLSLPLCKKCLNDAPAALVDLIVRQGKYITKLESNRDRIMDVAVVAMDGLTVVTDELGQTSSILSVLQLKLKTETNYKKTLTRP